MADTPEDYQRLELNPDSIAVWEDGLGTHVPRTHEMTRRPLSAKPEREPLDVLADLAARRSVSTKAPTQGG
jgi:hypothetical protein